MASWSTFIVRLYRRAGKNLTGVVEHVQTGQRLPFGSATELWNALLERSKPSKASTDEAPEKRKLQNGEKT